MSRRAVGAHPGEPVLEVRGVSKHFRGAPQPAVHDADLLIRSGECVGLVGESGSGKTTLGNVVCGLLRPTSGVVMLGGRNTFPRGRFDRARWRTVQMVFQDPYASLNPHMTVAETVAEPLRLWNGMPRSAALQSALSWLERVGISESMADTRPAGLSGGQRQRVSIARALAINPGLLVCDEAVSALDVSVQAQILALLRDLRDELGMAMLFITHDIGVVRLVSDRVVVMNSGVIVEEVDVDGLAIDWVRDPYTRRLLEAVPTLGPS